MSGAHVVIDPTRFQRFLNRVGGPGERLLLAKAERVADLARRYSQGHGTIPEGIIVGPVADGKVKVISTNPHTVLVHNGSPAHKIRPRNPRRWLRFEIDGRVVYAREVNHPGYRGDPFLTNALQDV